MNRLFLRRQTANTGSGASVRPCGPCLAETSRSDLGLQPTTPALYEPACRGLILNTPSLVSAGIRAGSGLPERFGCVTI